MIIDIPFRRPVAPPSHVTGGTLVTVLPRSPEIVRAYERRYGNTRSIIASSMAGRPIRRRPKLVLLNTTSLYGAGSSQYNRLTLPVRAVGGRSDAGLEYKPRRTTVGWGSFHVSKG